MKNGISREERLKIRKALDLNDDDYEIISKAMREYRNSVGSIKSLSSYKEEANAVIKKLEKLYLDYIFEDEDCWCGGFEMEDGD